MRSEEDGPLVPRCEPQVACVEIDRASLVRAIGPAHIPDEFLEGIGPMQIWRFEWRCGCRVDVWSVEGVRGAARLASILANDSDVDHVLHHLALPGPITWRVDREPLAERPVRPERWVLTRQDDNGIRATMRTFESRLAAECALRTHEERGHKQLYAIERA